MPPKQALMTRLARENQILARYFPSFQWKRSGTHLCIEGEVRTNSTKRYVLRVELPSDFPNSTPKMYVVRPRPLLGHRGFDIADIGANPSMHTLDPKAGAVRICHFHPDHWGPEQTLYKVVLKGRIWLEAFEGHVATGLPLDAYLSHQR